MPGPVGRGGALGLVLAAGLLLGRAAAQEPAPPPRPVVPAVPPIPPTATLPTPTPLPPQAPPPAGPAEPPAPLLERPPTVFAGPSVSPAAMSASGLAGRPPHPPPLPGSFEDQFTQEYEARRSFRECLWTGTAVTAFPNSLLWAPPLASPIEPRFQILVDNFKNSSGGSKTVETSIGNTFGMFRFEPSGTDVAYQVDIFAVVMTRLSPNDLLAADYRFGIPVTAKWGPWHAKLGYEHTSAHLGDEFIEREGLPPTRITAFSKDEVVLGVGRWLTDNFRLYGVMGYAYRQQLPDPNPDAGVLALTRPKWRFSAGFEWYDNCPTGWTGTPFIAANVDSRGDQAYNPNLMAQAGWMWRNPLARLATFRIFGFYYNGHSFYGQFYDRREKFYGIGFAGDY